MSIRFASYVKTGHVFRRLESTENDVKSKNQAPSTLKARDFSGHASESKYGARGVLRERRPGRISGFRAFRVEKDIRTIVQERPIHKLYSGGNADRV